MPILRDAAHAARSAFRSLGADLAYTRDSERKLSGIILRWGHAEPTATTGIVVEATYGETPLRFFVANENDNLSARRTFALTPKLCIAARKSLAFTP